MYKVEHGDFNISSRISKIETVDNFICLAIEKRHGESEWTFYQWLVYEKDHPQPQTDALAYGGSASVASFRTAETPTLQEIEEEIAKKFSYERKWATVEVEKLGQIPGLEIHVDAFGKICISGISESIQQRLNCKSDVKIKKGSFLDGWFRDVFVPVIKPPAEQQKTS